jgi:hypothetical protein
LLLRPDLHVAWRGNTAPNEATTAKIVAMAIGRGPSVRSGIAGETPTGGPSFVGFGPR